MFKNIIHIYLGKIRPHPLCEKVIYGKSKCSTFSGITVVTSGGRGGGCQKIGNLIEGASALTQINLANLTFTSKTKLANEGNLIRFIQPSPMKRYKGKDITQIEVFLSKIPKVQRGSVTKFATYFISGKFQTQFVANLGGSGKCTYLSFQQREKRKCLSPFLQLFPQSQTF